MVIGIRKLIFGIFLVFWNNSPVFSLLVFIIGNLVIIVILFIYKPYKHCILNYLNILYELSYSFTYLCSIILVLNKDL